MFDSLSIVPIWALVPIHLSFGVLAGVVQVRRGLTRPVAIGVLVVLSMLFAASQAARWDWNTRRSALGGPADSSLRLRQEALGVGESYSRNRGRWMAMTDRERWTWRLTIFGVVTGSLLASGVPTIVGMTRRPRSKSE